MGTPLSVTLSPRPARGLFLAAVLSVCAVFSLACMDQIAPMTTEQLCDDVLYAIDARIYECEGDEDAAVEAFHALQQQATCTAVWTTHDDVDAQYGCVEAVSVVPCDDVAALETDLGAWMAVDSSCDGLFSVSGSSSDTGSAGDSGSL